MAYIGNTVENQGFTPAIDYFNGNGVTVTFTLSRSVASVAQVIVAIDNVIQNPNSSFTVAGNAITFSSAPLSGTNNIWVEYTSLITTYNAISQDPTVIGDIRATGGYLAEGDFGNSFVDGAILDYVTGLGRITVGDLDGLTIYNGGTAARTALLEVGATGNINIPGTGKRITGDFSNATLANRVLFQTSTTNGNTAIATIPNGTATTAQWMAANSPDIANASLAQIAATSTEVQIFSNRLGTGTYLPLTMYTGGSERLRIDTSGNVGIGTSSPSSKFDVVGGRSTFSANSENFAVYLRYNNSTNGFYIGSPSADAMAFSASSGAERMRIDSSGRLFVNQTGQLGNTLQRMGLQFNSSVEWGLNITSSSTATGNAINFTNSSGTQIGQIQTSTTATAYVTSSDYRLKENIAPMTGALAKVAQLKPVTYKWKLDGSASQGFIAHELQEVVPECVTGEKDAVDADGKPVYQGIDTSFLVATLTASIQELKAIVDAQAARIAALETK